MQVNAACHAVQYRVPQTAPYPAERTAPPLALGSMIDGMQLLRFPNEDFDDCYCVGAALCQDDRRTTE